MAIHAQRVHNLLTRVLYTSRISFPKWDIYMQPGKHEALISFETFQKIQKRLQGNSHVPARKDLNKDFPLRNFVICDCCSNPLTAGWTKGRSKYYGYYQCQKKGCDNFGKSIKKETIEGYFEKLLLNLTPSVPLFEMAKAIFRDIWNERLDKYMQSTFALKGEITKIDHKVETLLDRIVESKSTVIVSAYEKRIHTLEGERIVLEEKIAKCGSLAPDYEIASRTALAFLQNPYNLWTSEQLEHRRAVLKLVFSEKLQNDKTTKMTDIEASVCRSHSGFWRNSMTQCVKRDLNSHAPWRH